ncbi:unnamed protein product [Clavelina lepadiformis]|uniref:C3/C5 convertase n=1 Tax=Clavelina lepadiformis TaxID=159417 RepID=A0ABP0F3S4_CLALP
MEIKFCQVCAVIVLLSTTYQISAQCPRRNQTTADAVGRPCRKPCSSQTQCKDGKTCRCDHECGMSCINMNNFCGLPSVTPNIARVRVYRRHSNGSLVLKPSPPYQYDDRAEYECAPGYRLEGSQNFNLCHGRKSWTRLAVCARSCRRFDEKKVLRNLMICGTNCVTSSECTEDMSCVCDGYCGRTCVNPDINCGEAPPSTHASIKYDGEGFQRRAYYRCDVGFYPQSGDLTRKCKGGGNWSGRLINCAPTTCGDPLPSIRSMGGEIVQYQHGAYLVGHQVTFQCSPGQRFLGDSVQTCMEDGQWSGLNAICDLIDDESRCPHPGVPINGNLLTRSNFTVGTMVEFECDEGYSMIGDRQQECFYFLQWSDGGAPKCIDPRYPASNSAPLRRLQGNLETTEDLVHSHSLGHSLLSTSTILHETIFVIDISEDVSDETLRVSLKFAENLVIEASRDNYLKCAIIVFASGSKVVLRFASVPTQEVIRSLRTILADREKFVQNVGELRNTAEGLRKLREVYLSIAQNISENMRNIFLFINGQHFPGLISPKIVMQDFIDGLSKNLLNIYVIAFGSNVHESATYEELQSLTYPRHLLLVNPTSIEVPDTLKGQDFCQCGMSGDVGNVKKRASIGRVVKGTEANLAAWPWQVLIAENRARVSYTYRRVRGGGSLINHRWVLTAAHVFHGMARPRDWAHNILLTFGIRQLPESDQSQLSSHVQVFRAKKIYEHEKFSINTFDYDIALVLVGRELKQLGLYWHETGNAGWVNYTSFVRPVCLPCMDGNCVSEYLERNERTLFGRKISESDKCKTEGDWLIEKGELERKSVLTVITGFGETRIRNPSDFDFKVSKFLNQALIRLHNDERCNRSIAQMRKQGLPEGITFTDQMICGIGGNPDIITDACKGDSGGTLVREFKENVIGKGCWMQIGIVSWGWGCGSTYTENSIKHQFPGYYTSVAPLMSWITEIQQQTESELSHLDSICRADLCQVEEGRTCKKPCENDADCRGALKRCVCDDVCGMSCINPKAPCDDLDTFSNGTIEGNRTYGNTVHYTCNDGFILKGTRTRTCRSDKKWTGTTPTCLELECVVPRAPSFGSVEPPRYSRVALDETITYSCGRRYRLVGISRATCQEDRTFTSPPPRCDEITCPRRTTPAEATPSSLKSRWLVDDVLSYTCDVGYDLRGNPSSTCLVIGRWSNALPNCRIRRCVHRDVPQHSTANPNKSQWVYGDRVTYTCDRGYELSGSAESRCTSSGRWSDPLSTCTIRSCEHPTPPRNVDKIRPANKMSWVYEDTITYGYSRGYRLNGARTLSCTEDGTWSHPVPTCQQITCERSDPDFGESIPRKERYIFEEKITYSCNEGLDLEGAIRSICQASGSWNNDPPNCYLPDRNPCPPGYTEKFPFCFRRFNERQSFQDATETCRREGATLPIIRDNHVRDKFVEMLHDNRELWIGISDEGKEGVLKWQNGDLYLSKEGGLVINLAANIKSSDCLTTVGRFGDTEWARCYHPKEFICMKWHSQVKAFKLTYDDREAPRYNGFYLPVEGKLIENNVFYRLNTTSEDDTYLSVQETANGRMWRLGERFDGGNTWLSKRMTSNFPQRLGSEWKIGHFAEDAEAVEANLEEYDAWGKFGEWELCSEDCGDGTRSRSRECIGRVPGSYLCPGLARQTEECKTRDCPPDSGVWKSWGGWTPCSVTCGEGNRRRWRVCGRYGRTGGACQGSSSEVERCSTPCPATKTSYSDKEYLIFRIEKNFNDARDACQSLGGDLALVKTEMIQNALSPIIGSLGRTPFNYGYFIGMTDQKQEGRWRWIDDTRLTHENWNWREPSNSGNEDCGSMFRNGGWNDLTCWRKTYYICERDMDPCSDTVCMNDGRCVPDSNLRSYECQCPSYTRGDHCERIFNPCWNSSCQSGNCHSGNGYYYCVCPENSFGLHCDNVVQCPKPRIEDIIQLLGNNQQDEYDVGTRLKFSCRDIEQTIEGYDEITCRRDGTWNKSPPNTCETLTCPSVTAPANGRIAESANRVHVRGSTIRFECNGGYEVEGRESIRYRDDYTWDGSVPTCRERKCPGKWTKWMETT